ncbi:MAG: ferredoxin [Acidimicrobiales bacterium]
MKRRTGGFLLRVDPILCDGFGHCAELAPELVTVDEWGYPVISREATPLSNRAELESARYAVRGCPRRALRIERVPDASA